MNDGKLTLSKKESMKNSNMLFLLFIFLSVLSCKKDNTDYLDTPDFRQKFTI